MSFLEPTSLIDARDTLTVAQNLARALRLLCDAVGPAAQSKALAQVAACLEVELDELEAILERVEVPAGEKAE